MYFISSDNVMRVKGKPVPRSIQVQFCSEQLEPLRVGNQTEAALVAHKAVASMSRHSWVGESVVVELPADVQR